MPPSYSDTTRGIARIANPLEDLISLMDCNIKDGPANKALSLHKTQQGLDITLMKKNWK